MSVRSSLEGTQKLCHHLHHLQPWLTREVPVDRRLANVSPTYKKGRKDPGIQAPDPSDLSTKEGHGADHLECHLTVHTGQSCDRMQSAWLYER